MRNTFSPKRVGRRVRARVSGVSQAELTLRDALPFAVRRIFLIDRETGILLAYVSDGDENAEDSDIIGGMLTAIRDFVEDAFGRGEEGELDAIRYGDRTILTETAEHTYIAVVTEGIVPSGFLAEIRQQLFQIEERYGKTLRTFDGDIDEVSGAVDYLMPLLAGGRPAQRNATGPIESTVAAERHISNTAAATLAITALLMLATAWWLLRLADAQFP